MASNNDYVYVEMIRDKGADNYEVVAGLFKGMLEDDGQQYILLSGLKNCTECLWLGEWDFLTIEVLEKDFRNMTYLTNSETDQEAALEIIQALYTELKEAGLEEKAGCGIIDIDKYSYVPKEYLEGKAVDTVNQNAGSYSNRNKHYGTTTGTHFTSTKPKVKPIPTAFKRSKSPKPTAAALAQLSDLMDAIGEGQVLVLPETPGDTEEPLASCTGV